MVSNPVTPRKAAHGQKQSQLQAGPQPTLPACNNCDTQSQEPSADWTSEFQDTSYNKSQPTGFQRINTIQ